ncbi:MAG: translation initiation factor [Acidobacteriota bacterium]
MSKPFHNPFESLAHLRGGTSSQDETREKPAAPTTSTRTIARAVVRIERSGRKGKEVTVIEQLDLSGTEREEWLKSLKAGLGCGGTVEGDSLVLQGDHRKRIGPLLSKRGVKKITIA